MRAKATIRDVAKKAGVSIATVSFVLNKRSVEAISEKVRRRVVQAANDLDYHPNASAAGLARKHTRNVAIVFYKDSSTIANPFYSFIVQGAVKETLRQGYNLLFSFIERTYEGYADLPKIVQEKNAEGVLFLRCVSPELVRDIQAGGIPVVTVDEFPKVEDVDSVHIDNHQGACLATEHLIELGHRRLAFLLATSNRPSIADRARGFRETLLRHGLPAGRGQVLQGGKLSFDLARERATRVLSAADRPTAVVCANDEVAAGVLRAAHDLGLQVPRDLSVVGFDDITMSRQSIPPLTTIRVDKEEMGRLAMARLLELVENKAEPPAKTTQIVPVELVVRGSTGPAPAGTSI